MHERRFDQHFLVQNQAREDLKRALVWLNGSEVDTRWHKTANIYLLYRDEIIGEGDRHMQSCQFQ